MSKVKCNDIDIFAYIESKASKEAAAHIDKCSKCNAETAKLSAFLNIVSSHYAKGKKLDQELEKKLQSINIAKMKKLPDTIAGKVEGLKERSIKSKLKKALGKGKAGVSRVFAELVPPQAHPMPASPKDITKAGKKKTTTKEKTAKKAKRK